jgi:DHA2 family multidrug resistance protein-like MFS transporter
MLNQAARQAAVSLMRELPSRQRWLVLAIVSVALLLIVIDMTVLYTALPRLTVELSASASAKLWILNIYALIVSGLLPGMGTLGDRVGHKRLFLCGLSIFGLASLGAACSASPAMLIAFRALLAVGAATMMPATLSIIRLTFADDRERAMAIGVWAAVASGGAALGPVIGGLLLEHFWWGSVFLINVPIVLAALLCGWLLLPASTPGADRPWDWIASLQAMLGLICTAYAFKELARIHPDWPAFALALAGGVAGLSLFVRRQLRSAYPLIDLALFRNRMFSAAVISAIVAAAAMFGMELLFSQRLQLVLDMSPLQAGLFMLPLPLAAFVAGPLCGRLLARMPALKLLSLSLFISGIGMGTYLLAYQAAASLQLLSLALLGAGLGATVTAASSLILQSAPAERAGMAASVEEVSYELGSAIGVTLMSCIVSVVYAARLELPLQGVPASAGDSLDAALLVAAELPSGLGVQLTMAARDAFDQGFVIALMAATVLLLATAWLVRPRRRN